ncbi:MAG: discoidin domain-containing protein [Akkermansiaceae bacterium]|nr:discoidin domain-containing protein [Akkermansiaceae bacterium]
MCIQLPQPKDVRSGVCFVSRSSWCAALAVSVTVLTTFIEAAPAAKPAAPTPAAIEAMDEGRTVLELLKKENHHFTDQVKRAYLTFAKAKAMKVLQERQQHIPDEFLDWVDSDPVVASTVYGSRQPAADILCNLRSLDLDLGPETVRKKYTQLALSMSVAESHLGKTANLEARPPLKLVIPPNPLKGVDTRDPNRELDLNDHIINFMIENGSEYEVKIQPTKMVKVDNASDPGKPLMKEVPDPDAPVKIEKRKRPLVAWQVMASKELQEKFNQYMESKGEEYRINDCVSPRRNSLIRDAKARNYLMGVFNVFKKAYIEKGLLPARRDPRPSLAECCAYLIRNDQFRFPAGVKRAWPLFPLNAPWPVTTFLALERTPLREAEQMWQTYVSRGKIYTYGNYVGSVAQDGYLLQTRSLAPFDYGYGSVQMALKDGGVCGTMAGISKGNKLALGIPSSTASQPGHCALVRFRYNGGNKTYGLSGEQFVTGTARVTRPHAKWIFNGGGGTRFMGDHETLAFAVNHGLQSYVDAMLIHNLLIELPRETPSAAVMTLTADAIATNPYALPLLETAQARAKTAVEHFRVWTALETALEKAAAKPGCPRTGYSINRLHGNFINAMARLPLPESSGELKEIYDYIRKQKGFHLTATTRYRVAVEGLAVILKETEAALDAYLESQRNHATMSAMLGQFRASAAQITDAKKKQWWAEKCLKKFRGREMLIGNKNILTTDATATEAAQLSGVKLPPVEDQVISLCKTLLSNTRARLKADLAMNEKVAEANKQAPKAGKELLAEQKEVMYQTRLALNEVRVVAPQIKDISVRSHFLNRAIGAIGDNAAYQGYQLVFRKLSWKVVAMSYQSGAGKKHHQRGYGNFIIDANPGTSWHTVGKTGTPQDISIDLAEVKLLKGFKYTPRKHLHGMVDAFAFYTSLDGKEWTLAIDQKIEGMTAQSEEQSVYFKPVKARYIKFVAKHVIESTYVAVAEIDIIEASE